MWLKIRTQEVFFLNDIYKTNVEINFFMLIYANMNMKITSQGYGVRSCLKLSLNKLKEMKDPTSISSPLGT
jgi:hypothetical protein